MRSSIASLKPLAVDASPLQKVSVKTIIPGETIDGRCPLQNFLVSPSPSDTAS